MFAALFAMPLLVRGLGIDRFGMLTLAWMVLGYFSLFDMGLGRSLTRLVADRLGRGAKQEELAGPIWTGLSLMAALGAIAVLVVLAAVISEATDILKIPEELRREVNLSLALLGCGIPIVITTTGFIGILEAHQRFDLVNRVRIPLGLLTFFAPLVVLPFSSSLIAIVSALLGVRVFAWSAYAAMVLRVLPAMRTKPQFAPGSVRELLSFGGWMTLSNIIGPLMVYLDRFVIGALISAAAVAYYATPYEVVTKLWIIPGAAAAALFPAFAAARAGDMSKAPQLFSFASRGVLGLMAPVVLVLIVFSENLLSLWLGPEFAAQSSAALRWLGAGVFVNSVGQIFFASVQGYGRPDVTAKLHALELPLYLPLLMFLLDTYGIAGAAAAWFARVALDTFLLLGASVRLVPSLRPSVPGILLMLCMPVPMFFGATLTDGIIQKFIYSFLMLGLLGAAVLFVACSSAERLFLKGQFRALLRTGR